MLLLAFWYADSEDRDGSWHWIGIAISLCQTIGLYRNPSTERTGIRGTFPHQRQTLSIRQLRLWQLLWWMSYFRDTWLSFGMGRPSRIDLSDCDMPLPTAADVTELTSGISPAHAQKYLPEDPNHTLSLVWASLLDITLVLGSILKNHYKAKPLNEHPATLIARDANKLLQCRSGFPNEGASEDSVTASHLYHLHVYYE